jgi:DNA-binding beta-propeller fold protein YncE
MPTAPVSRFGRFVDLPAAAWNDRPVIRTRQAGLARSTLHAMKRALSPLSILALLLLPLVACQQNGFIRVTVGEASDAGRGLPQVYQLRSLASDSDGGTPNSANGPLETDAITFPITFVVQVPPNGISLTEVVEGLDQTGTNVLLRGSNSTSFTAGSQAIPLQVTLSPACNSALDCNPTALCQGQLFCTAQGACVANATTSPPGFGTLCGNDGGRCDEELQCLTPFGLCGDGIQGTDPLPDGGFFKEPCDWGSGGDGGTCTGPDGGCNSLQPNHCRPTCVLPSCGDGVVDNGEKCDMGSGPAGNGTEHGCNATCTLYGTAVKIVGSGDVVDAGPGGVCPTGSTQKAAGCVCGSGCYLDGPGSVAEFQDMGGIAIVGTTLYVADTLSEVVRAVDLSSAPAYNVTTLAGNEDDTTPPYNGTPLSVTQTGQGTDAGFFLPIKPFAYQGTLLVGTGCDLQQVTLPGAVVTSLAGPGEGSNRSSENFTTPISPNPVTLAQALFNDITGIAIDPATGFLYTADDASGMLRVIDVPGNTVTNLAGDELYATFSNPTGVVVLNGGLFVTDTGSGYIKHVSLGDAGTVVTDVAGNGSFGFADSSASGGAEFYGPAGMCTDGTTIYIVDQKNQAVRQMDPVTFEVTTLIGGPDAGIFDYPYDCAWDPDGGVLYVSDQSLPAATPDGIGDVIWMVQ